MQVHGGVRYLEKAVKNFDVEQVRGLGHNAQQLGPHCIDGLKWTGNKTLGASTVHSAVKSCVVHMDVAYMRSKLLPLTMCGWTAQAGLRGVA